MIELILCFIAILLGLVVWALCEIGKLAGLMVASLRQISLTNDRIRARMDQ